MPQVQIIEPIRQQQTARLRVCAYARVSSDSEDQQHSFAAQVRYYTTLITSHEDWEFVDIYADEGITGTRADKREDFQRMMQDCRDGKIDRILVKSLSRFARNTQDCIASVRELKQLGVTVVFEKEHLNTGTMANEMFLSMMSAFAQEESISISQNMRKGARMRMENGTFRISQIPYGYRADGSGTLMIKPAEAAVVREIYTAYLSGIGVQSIAEEMERRQVPKLRGQAVWSKQGVLYILKNERYMGDARFCKSYRSEMLPFRKIENKGQKKQYYQENTHEPIADRNTFIKVQDLLAERGQKHGRPQKREIYPFTGRLICAECGAAFYRRIKPGGIEWACASHLHNDANACSMKNVSERELWNAVLALHDKLARNKEEILGEYLSHLRQIQDRQSMENPQILAIHQSIAKLLKQNHTLHDLRVKGCVDSAFFQSQANAIQQQLDAQRTRLRQYQKQVDLTPILRETKRLMESLEQGDLQMWFSLQVVSVKLSASEIRFTMKNKLVFTEQRGDRT